MTASRAAALGPAETEGRPRCPTTAADDPAESAETEGQATGR